MVACLLTLIAAAVICHVVAQRTLKKKVGTTILLMASVMCSLMVYFALLNESGGIDQGKWMEQMVLPVGLHVLLLFALMRYLFRILKK